MYRAFEKSVYPSDRFAVISVSLGTCLFLALAIYFEWAEFFLLWARDYEHWEIDELIMTPIALAIGSTLFFWLRSRALCDEIRRRRLLEEQLTYQANYDVLTYLPNRKHFLERLDALLDATTDHSNDIAVLFLDLDGFKVVNDSSGHEAGDQILLVVAKRLRLCIDEAAFLARLGGDEFTIMLEQANQISRIVQIIQRIQAQLKEPIPVAGYEVVIGTSIGVAFASDTNWTSSELLRNADAAMYAAKRNGKSGYEFFESEMNVRARTHLSVESELRQAIRQKQFCVYYQPIFHLLTNQVVGLEALVRWQHPQKGILTPDHFLDVAETSGLMNDIGDFVFLEACRQVSLWQNTVLSQQALYLSVNLSPRQFQHPAFVHQAADIIRQTAFPAERLHLEIIENMAMQDADTARLVMRQLRALGISVALDDFGTGYSSLSYLKRFPLNGLKIDRSFVMELERQAENLNIVRAIIALTQAMGLTVTAEGIETAAQLSTLNALGCTYGQGFYFARPMPANEMHSFLENHSTGTEYPAKMSKTMAYRGIADKTEPAGNLL
ncbi:MAG: EAL domain-containing protein [Caldilineaceae bacterium]